MDKKPNITTVQFNSAYYDNLNKEMFSTRYDITNDIYESTILYFDYIYNKGIYADQCKLNYYFLTKFLSKEFKKSNIFNLTEPIDYLHGNEIKQINEYDYITDQQERFIRLTKDGQQKACNVFELLLLKQFKPIYKDIEFKHEPNGINTHPDWWIKFTDEEGNKREMYIEVKSVYTTLEQNKDNSYYIKTTYNNATNCREKVKEDLNKIHQNNFNNLKPNDNLIYDTLTVFFYYYVDTYNMDLVCYDCDVIPLALALNYNFNDNGEIMNINIKSDGDNCINTSASLSLSKNHNKFKYNKHYFFDCLYLYLYGKTIDNKNHIVTNNEYELNELNDIIKEINNITLSIDSEIKLYNGDEKVSYQQYKILTDRFKTLKTKFKNIYNDKDLLNNTYNQINENNKSIKSYNIIKSFETELNELYSKLSGHINNIYKLSDVDFNIMKLQYKHLLKKTHNNKKLISYLDNKSQYIELNNVIKKLRRTRK